MLKRVALDRQEERHAVSPAPEGTAWGLLSLAGAGPIRLGGLGATLWAGLRLVVPSEERRDNLMGKNVISWDVDFAFLRNFVILLTNMQQTLGKSYHAARRRVFAPRIIRRCSSHPAA